MAESWDEVISIYDVFIDILEKRGIDHDNLTRRSVLKATMSRVPIEICIQRRASYSFASVALSTSLVAAPIVNDKVIAPSQRIGEQFSTRWVISSRGLLEFAWTLIVFALESARVDA